MTINDGVITSTNLRVTGSVTNTGNLTVNGNATIKGTLTAQEIKTEFVSASILFSSGSTIFGDSSDDTHQFTGSILIGSVLFQILILSLISTPDNTSTLTPSDKPIVTSFLSNF